MKHGKLQWHPAFGAALRITLRDEMDHLEMREEYLLGRKPLQMDILLIKNPKNIPVRKSIGQIFREHNIIEYKSPDDYLSINDFYKVYGYACLYQSDTDRVMQVDPGELTITFACSHFPREMLRHLQKSRGITAEDKGNGIFHLKGDAISMQLLLIPKLSEGENYWLNHLRTDLKAGPEIHKLLANYEKHKDSRDYAAVMDLITRANWEEMEVEHNMCDALRELLSEELQEALSQGESKGLAEGRSKGRSEGILLTKQIFKLSAAGEPIESIAGKCGVSAEEVRQILE